MLIQTTVWTQRIWWNITQMVRGMGTNITTVLTSKSRLLGTPRTTQRPQVHVLEGQERGVLVVRLPRVLAPHVLRDVLTQALVPEEPTVSLKSATRLIPMTAVQARILAPQRRMTLTRTPTRVPLVLVLDTGTWAGT